MVALETDVEAFIPASETSMDKTEKPSDVLAVGDTVEAKVLFVDPKERRITLSVKQLDRELQKAAVKKYSAHNPRPNLGDLFE